MNQSEIGVPDMKYKCGLCPKKYQSERDLDGHLLKIHGTSIAEIKPITEEQKSEFIGQCLELLDAVKKKEVANSSQG